MSSTPDLPIPAPEPAVPVLPLGDLLRRARLALYDAGLRVPLSWLSVGEAGELVFGDLTGRHAEEFLRFLEQVAEPDAVRPVPATAGPALFDDDWFELPDLTDLVLGGLR